MKRKRFKPTRKKIIINSREWKLESCNKDAGAEFKLYDKYGTGIIRIGVKNADKRSVMESLVHEIIEGTLTDENKRWKEDGTKMLFCFDHEYLTTLCPKIVTALASCGAIDAYRKVL